jgi:hypothetical protein
VAADKPEVVVSHVLPRQSRGSNGDTYLFQDGDTYLFQVASFSGLNADINRRQKYKMAAEKSEIVPYHVLGKIETLF